MHLTTVAVAGYALVELVEACNFSSQLQVAVLLHLPELGLCGEDVRYLVLENALHRSPYVCAPQGEVVYLYGLRLLVVDTCSVELVADLACNEA